MSLTDPTLRLNSAPCLENPGPFALALAGIIQIMKKQRRGVYLLSHVLDVLPATLYMWDSKKLKEEVARERLQQIADLVSSDPRVIKAINEARRAFANEEMVGE